MKSCELRSSERRRDRQDRGSRVRLGRLVLKLGQVGQEFVLFRQPREVIADHLVRPQRRLTARPQADEHAGNDGTVGLDLDAYRVVAQQVPTAQHMLEKTEENFNRPAIAVNQAR